MPAWLSRFFPIAVADRSRILRDPASQKTVGRSRLAIRAVDPVEARRPPPTTLEQELLSQTVQRSGVVFSSMVRLNGKRLLRHHRRVNGIIDITRIRLDQWLRDMDAPNKGIRLFSDGRSIATSGPRTYRIHVSVHLSGDDEQRETTRHWTVVMDRTGVRRIEPVA